MNQTHAAHIDPPQARKRKSRGIPWLLPILGLLLLFALLVNGVPRLSLTYDEPSHLASGYTFLARGMRGTWTIPLRGHPLLVNAFAALPYFAGEPNLRLDSLEGWGYNRQAYARAFIDAVGNLDVLEVSGRIPSVLLTLLLGAVVFRWAADLFGRKAGLVALALVSFDPTLLAHGRLATNDVGVVALGTLTLYLVWRWKKRPSWKLTTLIGIASGVTMLAKSSGILWCAAGFLAAVWQIVKDKRALHYIAHISIMGILALLLVWIAYGGTVGTTTLLPGIPLPAPLHWESVVFQTSEAAVRPFYALGRLGQGQRWWYFPLAFLIKNPLPFLITLGIAMLSTPRQWIHALDLLALFSVLYIIVAISKGPNIGYRHMLPIHPCMYLLITHGITRLWHLDMPQQPPAAPRARLTLRLLRLCTILLGLWTVIGTVSIHPHEIAYFNELIGGPENGWYYLSDSNTDWMQGLKALKNWQKKTGITFYYAGPEGYTGLEKYELDYIPLPSTVYNPEPLFKPAFYPAPGNYVISAHALNGLGFIDPDNYAWFRYHTPTASIAHVLYIYHIPPQTRPTWLVQCNNPIAPLDQRTIDEQFQNKSLRQITLDCTKTWVYPSDGTHLGWYGLHEEILQSTASWIERLRPQPPKAKDDFIARHLRGLPLSYRQFNYREIPAFALYERQGGIPLRTDGATPEASQIYVAPAGAAPMSLKTSEPVNMPLALNGPLSFLGAFIFSESETRLEIETWWQVTEGSDARSLAKLQANPNVQISIMAHVLTSDGNTLGVADGMGFPPTVWVTGDVIVQRHQFEIKLKQELGGISPRVLWLRTGVYGLQDGVRWNLAAQPDADAIFVLLCNGQ